MKKICFMINDLENSNGVTHSAINIVNILAKQKDVEITLLVLYKFDKSMLKIINENVKVKSLIGFYFRGLNRIVDLIPDIVLYKLFVKETYDIEVGFCMLMPIKIFSASTNRLAQHYVWMHGYDDELTLRKYYLKYDKIIFVCKENEQRFLREFNGDGKLMTDYCYNMVDEVAINQMAKEKIDLEKRKFLFVTVGRLSPEKGYFRLIQICIRLHNEGYDFELWIVGGGNEWNRLNKLILECNASDYIKLLGEQQNPYKYVKFADMYICSSFSEAFNTACNEAGVLGIPILTTNVAGAHEIIELASIGMVVELNDNELFKGIKSVLNNVSGIKAWKCLSRFYRNKFFKDQRMRQILDVMLKL